MKGKVQREQYLVAVGFGCYKWYQSQTLGDVPARRMFPKGDRHERCSPKGGRYEHCSPKGVNTRQCASKDVGSRREVDLVGSRID